MPDRERWWRITTPQGETIWTATDPSNQIRVAWKGALVAGPFVLEAEQPDGTVDALRDVHAALIDAVDTGGLTGETLQNMEAFVRHAIEGWQ